MTMTLARRQSPSFTSLHLGRVQRATASMLLVLQAFPMRLDGILIGNCALPSNITYTCDPTPSTSKSVTIEAFSLVLYSLAHTNNISICVSILTFLHKCIVYCKRLVTRVWK